MFILFFATSFLLFSCLVYAQTISVVFEDWPPYQFIKGDKIIGIDTEVLVEAFRRMDVTPKFRAVPWKIALKETESGISDVIFSLAYPDQHSWLYFPKIPINSQRSVFFVRKTSTLSISDIHDLEGMRVGTVFGNFYGNRFDNNKKIIRDESLSQHNVFDKLLSGRYNIMISFDLVGLHIAKEKKIMSEIMMLDYIVDEQPTFVGFSKTKGIKAKQMAEKLSLILLQLQKEGFIEMTKNKYLQ